jgi:HisJ family histidinol phosphate phosphatase
LLHPIISHLSLPPLFKNKKEARLRFVQPINFWLDAYPDYMFNEVIPLIWDCWPHVRNTTSQYFDRYHVKTAIFTSSQTAEMFREKYPDMNILCGMEMDWFQYPGWRDAVNYAVTRLNPDYIIGAMHFIDRGVDGILNVHDIKNAESRESGRLMREYYQNLIKLAEYDWRPMVFRFNWVAHFDLPRKIGLRCDDMENAALDALARNGVPLEINTALMGNRRYGPIGARARRIRQITAAGMPVLVSDDAHDVSRVGANFGIVEKLAKRQNFYTDFDKLKQKIGIRSR